MNGRMAMGDRFSGHGNEFLQKVKIRFDVSDGRVFVSFEVRAGIPLDVGWAGIERFRQRG
jgi:hypothetical protein